MGEAVITEEIMKEISLKDISRKLEEFAQARDWEKYHSPRNLLLAMVSFTINQAGISSFSTVSVFE